MAGLFLRSPGGAAFGGVSQVLHTDLSVFRYSEMPFGPFLPCLGVFSEFCIPKTAKNGIQNKHLTDPI